MNYIGIDGGGTKTAFGLFEEDRLIDTLKLPTCHFNQVGFNEGAKILKSEIEQLINSHDIDVTKLRIGIGMAGYGKDATINRKIEETFKKELSGYDYVLTSDIHIALIGALDNRDGIVVIAGTGTIAMALNKGKISRCGGWGYQLGDEGSAYWIGKQSLGVFTKMADGRLRKTDFYGAIKSELMLANDYELIGYVSDLENKRTSIADLAKTVGELAKQNDRHAKEILNLAAKEVSLLAKTLADSFEEKPIITYYGGVFASDYFKDNFEDNLEGFKIHPPVKNALQGACILVRNDH